MLCFESSVFSDFKIKVAEFGKDFSKTFIGHEAPLLSVAIDPSDKYVVRAL